MRKFLLPFFFAAGGFLAMADSYETVVIGLSDGTSVDIRLSEQLKFSFSETDLLVTGSDADISVPKSKIVKFVHTKESGIKGAEQADALQVDGNRLQFANLPEGSRIVVFDTAGMEVLSVEACGDFSLSLENMKPDLYIVNVNNMSYKIAVR